MNMSELSYEESVEYYSQVVAVVCILISVLYIVGSALFQRWTHHENI